MKKKECYILSNKEFDYFVNATLNIYCPDLGNHDCNVCPMNININHHYPKNPEYRCLLGMMEYALDIIKATKEGEV